MLSLTDQGPTNATNYHLVVITTTGQVVRSVTARVPSIGGHLPRFSVAGRSVYFLDGDRSLKALHGDGSVATIAELPGSTTDRVAFAVSPDEQRLAFAVLHYTTPSCPPTQPCYPKTSTSLRVGSLDGHDAHEIFAGQVVEFPIGWKGGNLLIAVAQAGFIQNPGEVNPYFAKAYHLVDPADGRRLYSTSPACDEPSSLQGPVNSAGTACQQNSGNNEVIVALGWDGSSHELFRAAVDGYANAVPPAVLSPDGREVAAETAAEHRISIFSNGRAQPTAAVGTPAGWFDPGHLLLMQGCCQPASQAEVLDVAANTVTPVTLGVTGSTDPYAPFFASIPPGLS